MSEVRAYKCGVQAERMGERGLTIYAEEQIDPMLDLMNDHLRLWPIEGAAGRKVLLVDSDGQGHAARLPCPPPREGPRGPHGRPSRSL